MKRNVKKILKLSEAEFNAIYQEVLSATRDEWLLETSRQKKWKAHKDTESIVLKIGPNRLESRFTNAWDSKWRKVLEENLLFSLKNKIGSFEVVRMIISKLKPSSGILEHIDTEEILVNSHRLHLPVKTNPEVLFEINKSLYHLEEGVVYEINNQAPHSVVNNSNMDRIHLIFDYVLTN